MMYLCQRMGKKTTSRHGVNLQNICITGPQAISIVSVDTSVLAVAKAEKTVRTLLHMCSSRRALALRLNQANVLLLAMLDCSLVD